MANQYIKIGVCLFECDYVITLSNHGPSILLLLCKKALDEALCTFVVSQFLNYQSTTY